ncbi:hypothetical protein V8C34DRAFT_282543 [Trichoderma compactum]
MILSPRKSIKGFPLHLVLTLEFWGVTGCRPITHVIYHTLHQLGSTGRRLWTMCLPLPLMLIFWTQSSNIREVGYRCGKCCLPAVSYSQFGN